MTPRSSPPSLYLLQVRLCGPQSPAIPSRFELFKRPMGSYFQYFVLAVHLSRCSVAASLTILYYDWLLTLPAEIRLYWQYRFSVTSFFYFLNRYSTLLLHIPVAIEFYADLSSERLLFASSGFSPIVLCVLLAIRTYALFGRALLALIFFVVYGTTTFGIATWAIVKEQQIPMSVSDAIPPTYRACGSDFTNDQARYLAIAWALAMGFDLIIFILTLYKRLKIGRTLHNSLFSLMIRDGTLYFGFLMFFYVGNLISIVRYHIIIEVSTSINIIATTLISRLMLNIRDPRNVGVFTQDTSRTALAFVHEPVPYDLDTMTDSMELETVDTETQ
ncbi:hypothetical protein K474DRAFT_1704765 [Panus rudis PR-1116 ss-1]|nr:hypothetical protein K474DRAFT_1704765 [Panus rudis PR-1116 ss-1]